jgi:hypothetical protein
MNTSSSGDDIVTSSGFVVIATSQSRRCVSEIEKLKASSVIQNFVKHADSPVGPQVHAPLYAQQALQTSQSGYEYRV